MTDTTSDKLSLIEEFDEQHIEQLHELTQRQWWGGKRTLEDVKLMAQNTSMMVGLIEKDTNQLIGFCRVLTDFAFRATIYDVMVADDWKGLGLGTRLMATLCEHPRLQRVSVLYLACEPDLAPFYAKWGFEKCVGKAKWMHKVQHEE